MKKIYENELSYIVRGIIYDVYKELGPGLLESVYVNAICLELRKRDIHYQTEVPVYAQYKGEPLGLGYRIDILVENTLILEIKSIETLARVHFKQMVTYLRLSRVKIGLLVNFNTADILQSIHRMVNGI